MSGVKGRSGRRTRYHELNVAQLAKMSEKSIRDCLKDPTVSIATRAQLGMAFLNKYMPDKIDQRVLTMNLSDSTVAKLLSFIDSHNITGSNEQLLALDSDIIEPIALTNLNLPDDQDKLGETSRDQDIPGHSGTD